MSNSAWITDAQLHFAYIFSHSCAILGTCVCFVVLVAYGIAACVPEARKHMDRVSFRLIIYSLIFNVLFGITSVATPGSPGPGCTLGAFCCNLFLCFLTFFTTCIAINLQLVVVHHIDGQRMEKYYLIGTTLLTMALNVPTLALHQFGWDEGTSGCWYRNSDPTVRLGWIIGTESFWIALAATIETICSCVVLLYMYSYKRSRKAWFIAPTTQPKNGTKVTTSLTRHSQSMDITQDPRYRRAILRIVLYPIVSLMVNYPIVALDLYNTIKGLHTQLDFRLIVLDLFLYGMRMLLYGLLAAVDPSFITALREILGRNKTRSKKASSTLEFVAANPENSPGHSQGTTIRGVQNSNSELTSSERGRISNMVGDREDVDPEQRPDVEMTRQGLESSIQSDSELRFPRIERQL